MSATDPQVSSLADVAIALTAVFVSIFLLISSIWICKYYFCPSNYDETNLMYGHHSAASMYGMYNVHNRSHLPENGASHHDDSEHPIVPFSTKVRSIFLETVLQHETFHPHKPCTATATGTDDLEQGNRSSNSSTTAATETPPNDDDPNTNVLEDIECHIDDIKSSKNSVVDAEIDTVDIKDDPNGACHVSSEPPELSTDQKDNDYDMPILDNSSSTEFLSEACAICFETLQDGDEITTSNCSKTFHRSCIITWLMQHDTCPYCRNTFKNINDDKNLDMILANDIFDCD